MSKEANVTQLLEQIESGDAAARDHLFSLVYDELRKIASNQMRHESPGITMQSTDLVHESWIKLLGNRRSLAWKNRGHFFAAASQAMRRILVDAARSRQRDKRGGNLQRHEIRDDDVAFKADEELIALHEALEMLQQVDPLKAQLVNLRYFGGFTTKQAAEQLNVSVATAERYWTFARAWLRAKMSASIKQD
ncbi:MAG: sigma-70 family RNA polymerase sigma factor [Planctomycetota bacterium]